MKIRPEEAEVFRADGRTRRGTYITELIVAFRNWGKAPEKRPEIPQKYSDTSANEWPC